MAQKEFLFLFGDRVPCFNVTLTVGAGGHNMPDDVMLVQTFFNFIVEGGGGHSVLALTSRRQVPKLTGAIDPTTLSAIHTYQLRWARLLLQTDGLIHPAHYLGRDLQLDPTTRRMTITLLHQHAQDASARMNEPDYTRAMPQMFPEMLRFVRGVF